MRTRNTCLTCASRTSGSSERTDSKSSPRPTYRKGATVLFTGRRHMELRQTPVGAPTTAGEFSFGGPLLFRFFCVPAVFHIHCTRAQLFLLNTEYFNTLAQDFRIINLGLAPPKNQTDDFAGGLLTIILQKRQMPAGHGVFVILDRCEGTEITINKTNNVKTD
ncbi:hypothetical protein MTP99_012427 [Tenebrio molitor]|nr:hypothetical protein MTP99_012427 [Tenebrio molitor]